VRWLLGWRYISSLHSADESQEGRNSCPLLRSCFIGSCHVGVSKRFSHSISLAVHCFCYIAFRLPYVHFFFMAHACDSENISKYSTVLKLLKHYTAFFIVEKKKFAQDPQNLHVFYFAIFRCAYFAKLKFRNFAKIWYIESL